MSLPTLWGLRVRKKPGEPWKRVRTWANPLGIWRSKENAEWFLDNRLRPRGYVGHAFPVEHPNAQPKVDDWLYGRVVPISKVPAHHRDAYRRTLHAAARAAKRAGRPLRVSSSYRFRHEQQALFEQNMIAPGIPKPGRPLTAVPGTSEHEIGIALDLPDNTGEPGVRDDPVISAALIAEGFQFTVPSEGWHVARRASLRE